MIHGDPETAKARGQPLKSLISPKPTISDSSLKLTHVLYNLCHPELYEQAIKYEKGSFITCTGALATMSGAKTNRSPKDKRVVREETSEQDLWWGRCIQPTLEELENLGVPDFTIYNAGQFPCNRYTHYMTSSTSIDLNFKRREMVILGTQYAGEMKKGLLSFMHYLMPKRGILSLHSGCNMGKEGDVTLFFGLLGTGKTTLSTDHQRELIGDDEHCWSNNGVSNIEGGCYAKCIDLSEEKEPDIWNVIKFGTEIEGGYRVGTPPLDIWASPPLNDICLGICLLWRRRKRMEDVPNGEAHRVEFGLTLARGERFKEAEHFVCEKFPKNPGYPLHNTVLQISHAYCSSIFCMGQSSSFDMLAAQGLLCTLTREKEFRFLRSNIKLKLD
ncbi:hypothetical protein SUGI_0695450 [Cryptomeria japonica]|nr:hypothetical protein SUGI_0695450 [Cryptomeria japonica]